MSERQKFSQIELYNKALQHKKKFEFDSAMECYEKLIEMNNYNYYAIANLGVCYRLLGNYNKSKEYFDKSISIRKNDEFSEINLAITYFYLGDYDKSIEILNSYKTSNKKNFILYYYLANCYREIEKEDINIFDLYEKAISLYYDCKSKYLYGIRLSDIYIDMVIAYIKKRKINDCMDILNNEKLDLYKDYKFYKVKGVALYQSKKYDKALESFKIAKEMMEKNPSRFPKDIKNYECWYNYALCLYELKKYDECNLELESFLKTVEEKENMKPLSNEESKLNSLLNHSLYIQGKILYKKEEISKAKEIFQKIDDSKLKDTSLEIFYYLGNIAFKEFKYRTALDYYECCLDMSNDNFLEYLHQNIALCHMKLGNTKAALTNSEKCIDKNSNVKNAYITKGNCLATRKEDKNPVMKIMTPYNYAIEVYSRKNKLTFFNKGNAQYNYDKYKEAIATFTKAISLDEKYFDAYLNRGNSYFKNDEIKKGYQDYCKCCDLFNEMINNETNYKKEEIEEVKEKILLVYANIINKYSILKEAEENIEDIDFYKEKLKEFEGDFQEDSNIPAVLSIVNDEGIAEFKSEKYNYLSKENLNFIQNVILMQKNLKNN